MALQYVLIVDSAFGTFIVSLQQALETVAAESVDMAARAEIC